MSSGPCPRWTFDPQQLRYLFLAVVVAQLVLISAQVTTKTGMPILQAVAFGMVAEVQRGGVGVVGGVAGLWTGYVDLRRVRGDNERLTRELGQARLRCSRSAPSPSGAVTSNSCSTCARA